MSFNFEVKNTIASLRQSTLKLGNVEIETPNYIMTHIETRRLTTGYNLVGSREPNPKLNELISDHIPDRLTAQRIFENSDEIEKLCNKLDNLTKSDRMNFVQFRLKTGNEISKYELCQIVRLQSDMNKFSIITIPDPTCSYNNSWIDSMEAALYEAKVSQEVGTSELFMPTVSLAQPLLDVEKKISWLIDKQVPSIGLRAHGPHFPETLHKSTNLITQSDNPIWIHLFDLSKKYKNVSQLHLAPLTSVDTISLKKKHGYSSSKKNIMDGLLPTPENISLEPTAREIEEQKVRKIKRSQRFLFEQLALGYISINERTKWIGHELSCTCPICKKTKDIDTFRIYLSTHDRSALLQVHEYTGFNQEMLAIRKNIRDNDISEYFRQKILVKRHRRKLSKRYPELERFINPPLDSYF